MITTTSKVLMSKSNDAERDMLRWRCEIVASKGGSYSIETKYTDDWYVTYTINWPESVAAAKP